MIRVDLRKDRDQQRGYGGCKLTENSADSGLCRHTNIRSVPCEALTSDCFGQI